MNRIGIDIGGTNVKGVVTNGDLITTKISNPTRDGADWKNAVRETFQQLSEDLSGDFTVGLSAPGIARKDHRAIAYMPQRLQGIEDLDWTTFLGTPTYVINDAHAALWAEAQWGAGQGVANVAMFTLGTGVGGGLLLNGRLHEGHIQRGGHLGHLCVDSGGQRPSITGMPGSLEDAVSEASLPQRSLGHYQTAESLVDAYRKGDTWATHVWLETVRHLALGIASIINAFAPDLVLLAGGMSKAGEDLIRPLQAFLAVYEWRPNQITTPIKIANFEEYAGAIGAALISNWTSEVS